MRSRKVGKSIHYTCRRRTETEAAGYHYHPTGSSAPAKPGSLEFFLAERYLLISSTPAGSLRYGRVHHSPYQLAPASCDTWSTLPAQWDGVTLPDDPPDSAIWADPVDVSVFPLRDHPGISRILLMR